MYNYTISKSVAANTEYLKKTLRLNKNFDIIYRCMQVGDKTIAFFFVDGFCKDELIQKIMTFIYNIDENSIPDTAWEFSKKCIPYTEVDIFTDIEKVIEMLLSGVICTFVDGIDSCIGIDARTYPVRGISEPWKERVLRGSRDGFSETLVINLALIRRRIRDPRLCSEILSVGERSKTNVSICYIDDKVDKEMLDSVRNKISDIKVEALTMNMESLAECLIKRGGLNPFPNFKYSERPDTAAASILDGNIVILVDNSPEAMILPTTIFEILEEADDFYLPPLIGSYIRLSRLSIVLASLMVTPLWIFFLNNPELVPHWLDFILITDDITVPVLLQLLILEIGIDGLRLAAINTPNMLSTPLSVIAGIVLGEFAVKTGWFNSESVFYMAFVSLATYTQPSFEFGYAIKFMRIILLISTYFFNVWGFIGGILLTLILICSTKTISGKSYIYPIIPFDAKKLKRKLLRLRLNKL
ncbi:MAG: spore germination protein [Lachnospira sp.]|nr:spore germination protein [Lachnospira sp.]